MAWTWLKFAFGNRGHFYSFSLNIVRIFYSNSVRRSSFHLKQSYDSYLMTHNQKLTSDVSGGVCIGSGFSCFNLAACLSSNNRLKSNFEIEFSIFRTHFKLFICVCSFSIVPSKFCACFVFSLFILSSIWSLKFDFSSLILSFLIEK